MRWRWAFSFLSVLYLTLEAQAGNMAFIPPGPFLMGSQNGNHDERPVHEVYLDALYIDRYLVTNVEYARFLNAHRNRVEGGKKWLDINNPLFPRLCKIREVKGRFLPRAGFENHPVVRVTWYGARAYARWVGKRLPTEAEWEKAARGGLIGKPYPWGDTITPDHANIKGFRATTPVGLYPPNPLGIYDLVANVWQWCSDWYDPEYYSRSPYYSPKGNEQGSLKVLRGGSWFHQDSWQVATRGADSPDSHHFCFVTGFRCVRDVEGSQCAGEKKISPSQVRITRKFSRVSGGSAGGAGNC